MLFGLPTDLVFNSYSGSLESFLVTTPAPRKEIQKQPNQTKHLNT